MDVVNNVTLSDDGLAVKAGIMTVYNYDYESGLFMGASDEYLMQGVGIPANSTSNAPPFVKAGKVNVFVGGSWKQTSDHRGETVYRTATGEPVEVANPGDYPEGTTPLKPATAFDVWNGKEWKTDVNAQHAAAVNKTRTEKSSRISEANSETLAWQTQLMLGIITDNDKQLLTKWMQYIQAVQKIDEAEAPDIAWPEKPA